MMIVAYCIVSKQEINKKYIYFRKKRNPSVVYQSSGPSSYRTYNTYSSNSNYNNDSPSYSYSSQISSNSFRPYYS